jgi:hypothetical protein
MVSRIFDREGRGRFLIEALGGCLSRAASYGGDEHDFVAVLEGVGFAAEEADVFVVDIDVDEAAELSVVAFDLGGERGECLVDISQKAGEVSGGGVEVFAAIGVAGEGCGKGDFDRHFLTPWIDPDEVRRECECLATSRKQQIPPLRCRMTTKKRCLKKMCYSKKGGAYQKTVPQKKQTVRRQKPSGAATTKCRA